MVIIASAIQALNTKNDVSHFTDRIVYWLSKIWHPSACISYHSEEQNNTRNANHKKQFIVNKIATSKESQVENKWQMIT